MQYGNQDGTAYITFLKGDVFLCYKKEEMKMFEFMTIRELYEIVMSGSHVEQDSMEYVQLQGWIRTNRCSGKLGFIAVSYTHLTLPTT